MERITASPRRIGMRRLRIFSAVAGIALLAACGSNGSDDGTTAVPEDGSGTSESETTAEPASIVSTKWILKEVATADVSLQSADDGPSAWLQINDAGEVTGSTGCNGFGGSAEVGEGVVTFEPLLATKKGCSGELGEIDTAMLTVLRGEVTAEVSGDSLTMTNADGDALTLSAGEVPSGEL